MVSFNFTCCSVGICGLLVVETAWKKSDKQTVVQDEKLKISYYDKDTKVESEETESFERQRSPK